MIIFKEKLYSRSDEIIKVVGNGEAACIDIIKCMEFYKSCPNDLTHWIDDVACQKFENMTKFDDIWGGFLILPGLDRNFISSELGRNFVAYQKKINLEESIKHFKKQIETAKNNGNLKYSKLLPRDSKKEVIWKHSNKYYATFFKYLALLLNFQINPSELPYLGIGEDGETWGNITISKNKSDIKNSGITPEGFKTLISVFIYYMNYGIPTGNRKFDNRVQN